MEPSTQRRIRIGAKKPQGGEGLSLRQILDVIRRRRNWFVIPVLLSVIAFGTLAYILPATYTSEVGIAAESLVDSDRSARPDSVDVSTHLSAITAVIHRRSVIEQIIEELRLHDGVDGHIPLEIIEQTRANVDITVEGEETFKVAYTHPDPEVARDVAARLTDVFITEMSAARRTQADAVEVVLDRQIADTKTRLEGLEQAIADYKSQAMGESSVNEASHLSELRRLEDELQRKQDAITYQESLRVSAQTEMTKLEEAGVITPESDVTRIEEELAALKRMGRTERHPDVIAKRRELEAARAAEENGNGNGGSAQPLTDSQIRYMQLEAQVQSVDNQLTGLRRDRDAIQSRINNTRSQLAAVPTHERQLSQLERDHELTQSRYDELINRQQDSRLTQQLSQSSSGLSFRIIEPARVPLEPSGPQRLRLLVLGLGVGLALACAATFVVEQTDASFVGIDEFHDYTDIPVLAWVPHISTKGSSKAKSKLVTLTDPLEVATEQYRLLAMKARDYLDRDDEQVLMVTSAAGGEGKTTTSINLAVALSQQVPGRVLLMDCDLRWPRVYKTLNEALKNRFAAPKEGFSDLLQKPEGSVFRATMRLENLHVIADDEGTDESFDVLASAAASKLLAQLRQSFDYIILDAPPILPMADGHMLASLADKVLVVVRARHTRREYLQRAIEDFDEAKVPGVVLNDVDYTRTRYGSAYKYYTQRYAKASRKSKAQ